MKNTFAINCLIILLAGCGLRESDESVPEQKAQEYITIKKTDTLSCKLSEIFEKIELVPLRNNANGAKVFNKIIIKDNYIYVMDKERARGVFQYSRQGEFLQKFGAPNDSIAKPSDLSDFDVFDNKIILSYHANLLLSFDVKGKLLKKQTSEFTFSSFISIKGGYLFYVGYASAASNTGADYFNVVRTDSTLKFNEGYLPFQPELLHSSVAGYASHFQRIDTNILFSQSFTNRIYSYEKGTLNNKVQVNFVDNPLPEKYTDGYVDKASMATIFKTGYAQLLAPFFYTSKYGFYQASLGASSGYIVRGPGKLFVMESYYDDFFGVPIYDFAGVVDSQTLVGTINWLSATLALIEPESDYLKPGNPYKVKLLKLLKKHNIKQTYEADPFIAIFKFKN
jgi:hypothetical protein